MDTAASSSGAGGPAPFLLKTYEMVDDSTTDEIVSWSPRNNSFIVWNPPEFARLLLPTYFKHSNFSSFIRQLNTYGFRKIDPERWEFCNEEFIRDQKHLLKNIHRRKPIHSHSSQPQQQQQQANNASSSAVDAERAAFDEEINRLSNEKAALESKLSRMKEEQSTGKLQVEELVYRMMCMDRRQEELLVYLEKAVQNPSFVENLAKKIESMDLSAYNKKRRVPHPHPHPYPQVESGSPQQANSNDNVSSSRTELGNSSSIIFPDFTDRLRLELSSVVSDINLVSHSTQSSNEEEEEGGLSSPQIMTLRCDGARNEGALSAATAAATAGEEEVPELSDTGTSFMFMKMDSVLGQEDGKLQEVGSEEGETSISCHLNLTLASLPLQIEKTSRNNPPTSDHAAAQGGSSSVKAAPAGQGRVNDVFWEQFLTEKPGVSDNEEASSDYREKDVDRRFGYGVSKNAKSMERLTL